MEKDYLLNRSLSNGKLLLVNAEHPYREDPEGIKLLPVNAGGKGETDILLEEHALRQFSALMEEIDGWGEIVPVSGFRSFKEQQKIYAGSLAENGEEFTRKFVALPGCSEHQTGLAIDLGLKQETVDFIRPDFPYAGICQRFRKRAAAYGFIERYQKEKEQITGIAAEPWHFRYVGCLHAKRINDLHMCLEEYVAYIE